MKLAALGLSYAAASGWVGAGEKHVVPLAEGGVAGPADIGRSGVGAGWFVDADGGRPGGDEGDPG